MRQAAQRGFWWLAFLLSSLPPLCAQAKLSGETLLLARIRARAAENLRRLPNYTCLETIERSMRRAASRRFELIDLVRLEVAYVDGKEMFAWPGSRTFEDRDITEMVSGGAIGNGSFALHARGIFLSNSALFQYAGEITLAGRAAVRFDYHVPMVRSGYKLRVKPEEGIVGYKGSFWIDPQTLDLMRLDVDINDIPPNIPVAAGRESLEYARAKIGGKDFLLPRRSELMLTDLGGNESRNYLHFNGCREFSGESVINFEDVPEGPIVGKKPPVHITLAEGLDVDLKLQTTIEAGVTAMGDPVTALVARDVRGKGHIYVPKGAVVAGRIVRLQRGNGPREAFWALGLLFDRIDFENQFGEFRAHMYPVTFPPSLAYSADPRRPAFYPTGPEPTETNPRIGILYLKGEKAKLPAGISTSWRTLAPTEETK
ncbi:MAG: hypothetical protein LC126_13390 [Bryobacterales bacterium]|nr:hypothetical protein [Bryobacterales bacterium]